MKKLRIIVGGLVGAYPLGGVAWDYFHYVLGLHQLGHDVIYYEDTWTWPFDPTRLSPVQDPGYTLKFLHDFFAAHAPQLADRWHYVHLHEKHFGMDAAAFAAAAREADIFLNVSGACFVPQELGAKCVKVFLDTDPGYNQILLVEKFKWSDNVERWCETVRGHDRHLTYGENIGAADCKIPSAGLDWRTTRCVVTLPQWAEVRTTPIAPDAPMTTIMTYDWFKGKLIYDGVDYGTKVPEYEKFREVGRRTRTPILLAIGGIKTPHDRFLADGWKTMDGFAASLTPESYRQFIAKSAGEWSVAKHVYAAMRTGWFSCRTACYLAAGRPAVVQETGWSKFIPAGAGVLAFSTMEETLAGLEAVAAEPAKHRAAAYEIAREYLSADRVLPEMIGKILGS